MNHRTHRLFIASSSIAAAAFVAAPSFAAYKCDAPTGLIDSKGCAAAQQGPEALRRFIQRTQWMWGTTFYDYVRDDAMR
jgi:hypothetical protein